MIGNNFFWGGVDGDECRVPIWTSSKDDLEQTSTTTQHTLPSPTLASLHPSVGYVHKPTIWTIFLHTCRLCDNKHPAEFRGPAFNCRSFHEAMREQLAWGLIKNPWTGNNTATLSQIQMLVFVLGFVLMWRSAIHDKKVEKWLQEFPLRLKRTTWWSFQFCFVINEDKSESRIGLCSTSWELLYLR